MPRGPDPQDAATFAADALPALRTAVDHLSWLLGHGYSETAALDLVGDHLQLTRRQRQAVRRCTCTPAQQERRRARRVQVPDGPVAIDGFNVLITLEKALGGGPVLIGRDGAWRDLAGVHGTWRSVEGTTPALEALGRVLADTPTTWVLDRPVSNAGRLATSIRILAAARAWPWTVRVEDHADAVLAAHDGILASSDGGLLDRCEAWTTLEPLALAAIDATAWTVTL